MPWAHPAVEKQWQFKVPGNQSGSYNRRSSVSYPNLVFSRANQTKRTSHSNPTFPHTAPDRLHRRHLRRRPYLPSRRNFPRPQWSAILRRGRRVPLICPSNASCAPGKRQRNSQPCRAQHKLPCPLPAAHGCKPVPLRQLRLANKNLPLQPQKHRTILEKVFSPVARPRRPACIR